MVTALFKEGQKAATTTSLQKYDYGEVLRIKGLSLPRYVAVQFAVDGMSEALPSSIGETVENVTDVLIPNSLLRSNIKPWNYNIMAYIYIVSGSSGKTEYTITIPVKWRPKTGDDQAADDDVASVIGSAVEKMNTATTKAENAATQASATAEEIKADREKITTNEVEIAELKSDLINQENKLEPIVKSNQDLKDVFYICDADGNIICKVDKDGVHSTGFDGKNLALNDVISTYEDSFYISDADGNVIFMADKDGVRGLNMGASSGIIGSPFKGMKLLTIGDSLSAHNNWQKWLVEWLGVTFDNDENINGKDGHKPMAKGGTAIAPTSEDSIYMRALDAKYYIDDTNGTVIIIYAGQNDSVALGTIDDTPYTDKVVITANKLTFYSSYMGMVENILADIPSARIYLMTQMPVRLEIGMEGTAEPYTGVVRFPDMASVLAYEASRYKKVEAIRAISKKYSLPCIDLWADSGINDYNSKHWYGAVGGTCGQVHPNDGGYKRMAEVAVAKMY